MSKLNEVCEVFEKVEATSSRLSKEALLCSLRNNPDTEPIAREMFSIALDWFRRFGIQHLPAAEADPQASYGWYNFLRLVEDLEKHNLGDPHVFAAEMLVCYSPLERKWLSRVLLKDLQMGVSYGLVEKLWPGLIKTFECQLAEVASMPVDYDKKYYVEPKIDGVRAVAFVDPGIQKVLFLSRGGQELANCDLLEFAILDMCQEPMVFDGELFVASVHKTLSVVRSTVSEPDPNLKNRLRYYVFDGMTKEEWTARKTKEGYLWRHSRIPFLDMSDATLARVVRTTSDRVFNDKDLQAANECWLGQGFEGIMLKEQDAHYVWDRSTSWLKHKPVMEGDFEVIADYEGQAKATKGKLGGVVVRVGDTTTDVGGGFDKPQRELYWREKLIGKIVQVEYKGKTPDGKLREPVFVRVRDDKHV